MAITLGVLRERATGETRVAVVPDVIKKLKALGVAVCVETQAGASCYLSDEDFGADTIALSTTQVFSTAQVLLTVHGSWHRIDWIARTLCQPRTH